MTKRLNLIHSALISSQTETERPPPSLSVLFLKPDLNRERLPYPPTTSTQRQDCSLSLSLLFTCTAARPRLPLSLFSSANAVTRRRGEAKRTRRRGEAERTRRRGEAERTRRRGEAEARNPDLFQWTNDHYGCICA